jgi:hypothetical protein
MAALTTLLAQIDNGTLLLPEFQRGYVWNRDQVRGLMRSLYRRYPVGSLLVWQTSADGLQTRSSLGGQGVVELLLDGQQRITTLYGIVRGKPPVFFEGKPETFAGLQFHMDEETFEFYAPAKMKGNPRWVDVTTLMQEGIEPFVERVNSDPELAPHLGAYITRLNRIHQVKELEFHIEKISGDDKTLDTVVEIFDRVNSGGTKLSKADLALAKLCAEWPEARARLRDAVGSWSGAGFSFRLDWFLRVVNAVVTGDAKFEALEAVDAQAFSDGLERSKKVVDNLLNNVSAHLGLDHDRVLFGRYAFPVMARHLDKNNGKFADARERDHLLYWYLHAALWGRFSGSNETIINQDIKAADDTGVDGLIEQLRLWRGELRVRPENFAGHSLGARFYPLLYLLTRVRGAKDLWNGAPVLSSAMLGKTSSLQVHHIFPKARLYENEYTRAQVNAVANFCFLTQETNLWVGARDPADYLAEVEDKYPGSLASQWIPADPQLWHIERYPDFLTARRELLAEAATEFLDGLLQGRETGEELEPAEAARIDVAQEDAYPEITELVSWLSDHGYAEPGLDIEIADPDTGDLICVAEAVWPDGLQEGIGEPVVLEYELDDDSQAKLASLGYRAFPTVESLREHVERQMAERIGLGVG